MINNKVSYARLYNLGNYENRRFEAEAEVVDGNVAQPHSACVGRSRRARAQRLPSASAPKSSAARSGDAAEQRRRAQSATEEPISR